ncbi:MAG: hypothetical protein JO368_01705, partial [Acidimicrobiales bacterium]|nr:hypothetical protein [Acidimicrobiales bacterium]
MNRIAAERSVTGTAGGVQGPTPVAVTGQGRNRTRSAWKALLAAAGLLAGTAGLVAAAPGMAGASTLDGVATPASQGTTSYLASGGSTTEFTVALPAQAACSGDSATNGYRVFSYFVEAGTNVANITFPSGNPNFGANQYGLIEKAGNFWEDQNTAPTTGEIINIPNDFEWEALITKGLALNSLLYQSSNTQGVWEAGIACTNSSGVVSDYWNSQFTFNKASGDPNGFNWMDVPGPAGSQVPAITAANNTTFTEGQAGTFTVTATGNPTPALGEFGTL